MLNFAKSEEISIIWAFLNYGFVSSRGLKIWNLLWKTVFGSFPGSHVYFFGSWLGTSWKTAWSSSNTWWCQSRKRYVFPQKISQSVAIFVIHATSEMDMSGQPFPQNGACWVIRTRLCFRVAPASRSSFYHFEANFFTDFEVSFSFYIYLSLWIV